MKKRLKKKLKKRCYCFHYEDHKYLMKIIEGLLFYKRPLTDEDLDMVFTIIDKWGYMEYLENKRKMSKCI